MDFTGWVPPEIKIGCALIIALGAFAIWGVWMSGQIGYERGSAAGYAESERTYDANRKTMEQIGTCRWAEVYAGCKWKLK